MRNRVVEEIERLAEKDAGIYLFTGDLGYGVLDSFAGRYPERFINAGISEGNMAAAAAGLALEGNTVYTYSIGNFPGMRCLEWVRNDICYHNANVKIIAVGGGLSYGQLGMSHHATEDVAIMRALPNMRVYVPADPSEAAAVVRHVNALEGPCYIRIGKGREADLHLGQASCGVEGLMPLEEGGRVAILAAGPIMCEAVGASRMLREDGIHIGLYHVAAVKPLDVGGIEKVAHRYEGILTLEEHNVIGGLGGAVSEVVSGMVGTRAAVVRMGLGDEYASIVGSQAFLRDYYGISARHIVRKVKGMLL